MQKLINDTKKYIKAIKPKNQNDAAPPLTPLLVKTFLSIIAEIEVKNAANTNNHKYL